MNTFLRWAAMVLISYFTDQALSKSQIERVKNFIVAQANEAISNAIKHERAAALIKELAGDLSATLVDWIVRTVLWVARAIGQIQSYEVRPALGAVRPFKQSGASLVGAYYESQQR